MFELGRERAVAGDGGPAVFEHLYVRAADVDHRLDGEDHARLELGAGAGTAGVDDLGAVVKDAADAVAAEIADDAIALAFGMALDRIGDVAEMVAGPGLFEAEHQAFVGHVDQLASFQGYVPDEVHAAGIAVPAVENRRDVDVDDVAVLENLVARDAVADDMVDRDAAALGVAAVAERRGQAAAVDRHLVDNVVERLGRDAWNDMRHQRVEDFGGEPSGAAHALEALSPVELDDP